MSSTVALLEAWAERGKDAAQREARALWMEGINAQLQEHDGEIDEIAFDGTVLGAFPSDAVRAVHGSLLLENVDNLAGDGLPAVAGALVLRNCSSLTRIDARESSQIELCSVTVETLEVGPTCTLLRIESCEALTRIVGTASPKLKLFVSECDALTCLATEALVADSVTVGACRALEHIADVVRVRELVLSSTAPEQSVQLPSLTCVAREALHVGAGGLRCGSASANDSDHGGADETGCSALRALAPVVVVANHGTTEIYGCAQLERLADKSIHARKVVLHDCSALRTFAPAATASALELKRCAALTELPEPAPDAGAVVQRRQISRSREPPSKVLLDVAGCDALPRIPDSWSAFEGDVLVRECAAFAVVPQRVKGTLVLADLPALGPELPQGMSCTGLLLLLRCHGLRSLGSGGGRDCASLVAADCHALELVSAQALQYVRKAAALQSLPALTALPETLDLQCALMLADLPALYALPRRLRVREALHVDSCDALVGEVTCEVTCEVTVVADANVQQTAESLAEKHFVVPGVFAGTTRAEPLLGEAAVRDGRRAGALQRGVVCLSACENLVEMT